MTYQAGTRHTLEVGAPGIAILAGRPEAAGDNDHVREARRIGYAITRGELQEGAVGCSAPVPSIAGATSLEASIGVVAVGGLDTERAGRLSMAAAAALAAQLA